MKIKLNFVVVVSVILFVGCSNPEKRAQKLIKESLQQTLNDPKSYESMEFGSLDSLFTNLNNIPDYYFLSLKFDMFLALFNDAKRDYNYAFDMKEKKLYAEFMKDHADSMQLINAEIEKIENTFISEFDGWKMTHKFRANNAMGAKTIGSCIFFFDKDITTVTESIDLKN